MGCLIGALEDRAVDLKHLGAGLNGARLSFTAQIGCYSPDRLMTCLGVIPGSVSPYALINDVERDVTAALDTEMLTLHPLTYHLRSNKMTIAVSPDALLTFLSSLGCEPEIINFAAVT